MANRNHNYFMTFYRATIFASLVLMGWSLYHQQQAITHLKTGVQQNSDRISRFEEVLAPYMAHVSNPIETKVEENNPNTRTLDNYCC